MFCRVKPQQQQREQQRELAQGEAGLGSLCSAVKLEGPRDFLWLCAAYLGGGCKL